MNFSAISDRSLAGKLLRLPLRLIPPDATMPVLQGRLNGKRWIVGSGTHGCWLGSYEYDLRRIFETLVKDGTVVFDIGAHVGFYTLLASVLVGSRGKVFAFEPNPRNLRYLKEHIQLNGIKNASIIEAAVSDSDGAALFEERSTNSTGRLGPEGQLRVNTVTIDEAVSSNWVPPPEFMKIDVEGTEMLVLRGARFTLSSCQPTVFLETHGRQMYSECCQFFQSLHYDIRKIGTELSQENSQLIAYPMRRKSGWVRVALQGRPLSGVLRGGGS